MISARPSIKLKFPLPLWHGGSVIKECPPPPPGPLSLPLSSPRSGVTCPVPAFPTNGRVRIPSGISYGSTVIFSCSRGYRLVGSTRRSCQASQTWSGAAPTCVGEYRWHRDKQLCWSSPCRQSDLFSVFLHLYSLKMPIYSPKNQLARSQKYPQPHFCPTKLRWVGDLLTNFQSFIERERQTRVRACIITCTCTSEYAVRQVSPTMSTNTRNRIFLSWRGWGERKINNISPLHGLLVSKHSHRFKCDKMLQTFSGGRPIIAFLYLFLFCFLLHVTTFLSQNK